MRIIDKNYDFYDYLQSYSDSIVFDRRNSFLLTKERICDRLHWGTEKNLLLLQCGVTFWLLLLTVIKATEDGFAKPLDYELALLDSWKDYDRPRKCISFTVITRGDWIWHNKIESSVERLRYAIDHNDYKTESDLGTLTSYTSWNSNLPDKTYDIPLLYACGISQVIDPQDIFCAIEEYFSLEKTAAERTEPLGATNDDKIVMHGFDTKTSFRGKRK